MLTRITTGRPHPVSGSSRRRTWLEDTLAWAERAARHAQSYTGELKTGDLHRLFNQEAPLALRVLTRDQAPPGESVTGLRRLFANVRIVFRGMLEKLSPARRLLFLLALVCFVLGLIEIRAQGGSGVVIDISPFWVVLSSGLFVFLLALELVDRVLVRDELDVARQLQRELLPAQAPEVPGYGFALSYRTANEVGGDYYGVTPMPDGRVAIAVGDASGHGMAAGLLMAIANAVLGLAVELDSTPDRVAALLNRVLCRTGDRRSFMTLFFAMLSPATGELRYTCAGHPFPLLRRADGGIVELGRGGYPLGIREPLELETRASELGPGDVLLLFSDGLPEAVNAAGTAFGFDCLSSLLAGGGTPQVIHDRIIAALDEHLAGARLQDDVSVVVVRRDFASSSPGA
jgi:hypothetical protein